MNTHLQTYSPNPKFAKHLLLLHMLRIARSLQIAVYLVFPVALFAQVKLENLYTTQAPLPCINKTFSIVAHTVRDTFGEQPISVDLLKLQIDTLNDKFAPICVKFEICEYHTIDNYRYDTIDIERVPMYNEYLALTREHNRKDRINLYVVGSINYDNLECGFATQSGITRDTGAILLKKDCVERGFSKTLAHYMGRYFGLLPTSFEVGPFPALVNDPDCDKNQDAICDTPTDPYRKSDFLPAFLDVALCRFIYQARDPNSVWYDPDVANIMSYFPDKCKCGFTYGQYQFMADEWLNSARLKW